MWKEHRHYTTGRADRWRICREERKKSECDSSRVQTQGNSTVGLHCSCYLLSHTACKIMKRLKLCNTWSSYQCLWLSIIQCYSEIRSTTCLNSNHDYKVILPSCTKIIYTDKTLEEKIHSSGWVGYLDKVVSVQWSQWGTNRPAA